MNKDNDDETVASLGLQYYYHLIKDHDEQGNVDGKVVNKGREVLKNVCSEFVFLFMLVVHCCFLGNYDAGI